jgi:hypothetical protein
MKYAYYDLGQQPEGSTAVVRLRGSSANVFLLDRTNFRFYRAGQDFFYHGGFHRRTPVHLPIPRDGYWYVVIDLGGHSGHVRGTVEVLPPADATDREPMQVSAAAGG